MPRLRPIRLGALEALADQLRFVPRATICKQLLRAQSLAMGLDDEQTYREDWLIEQVTGFRPELESPSLMLGQALRRELSAFLERLCDSAKLTIEDAPAGALRVEALAARWEVSQASVGRYRQRGLLAWRVRTDEGRPVLLYPIACVQWFEHRERLLLEKAGDFSRIDETDRARLCKVARRASARFGWNQSKTMAQLAQRTGRSNEAMRQLLQDDTTDISVFAGRSASTKSRRERALRRVQHDEPPVALATALGVSSQTARRMSLWQRATFVLGLTLPAGSATATLPRDDLLVRLRASPLPTELRRWLANCRADGSVDIELEIESASAIHAWQARAGSVRSELASHHISATLLDGIETDLRRAAQLAPRIVTMHRRTMLTSIESRLECSMDVLGPVDARSVYDAAHMAACRAVLRHDPARSERVAGVITLAVDRAVASLMQQHAIHAPERVQNWSHEQRAIANVTLVPWWHCVSPWSRSLLLSYEEIQRLETLPDTHRAVLELRFGGSASMPQTIASSAEHLGTTVMAIVRMQRSARQFLRQCEASAASDR